MLVYNTVEYDARVRRSARSLTEAGFDVIVLGLEPEGSTSKRSWEGFELRLVPRRDSFAERKASAKSRVKALDAPLRRTESSIRELRARTEVAGSASLSDRALVRLYTWRRRRAKRAHGRARETSRPRGVRSA